ncbi:bifunctional (p)ppGpp synthetase/guanosine-3',5'-bis(diphosphate) 3'-pyrophosphohydrolase [Clostridiaceae bacterium]|nr:bifunctional (p)ppGpp synthetase/guanosine-3',5'-bis(diphosphate) 3'-pyrophosphohydrolase [Clostridiaceae bacterium]
MVQRAAKFAEKAHAGMLRKGGNMPYIYHPMEVALLVSRMTQDEHVIAAAYLHDVLEDTAVTAEELEEQFGERVLMLVQAETEDKSRTWKERKGHTIQHLEHASFEVKLLTLADKLSNMRCTARDYLMIGDEIWARFNEKRKASHKWYAKGILDGLTELADYPAYQEYKDLYQFVFGA